MNHYVALVILSLCIALVFALITKETKEGQVRYFLKLMGYMALGSFVASWIMYAVP